MAKRGLSLRGTNKKWQRAFYNAAARWGDGASQSDCSVAHGV